jgi:hypothetical protein
MALSREKFLNLIAIQRLKNSSKIFTISMQLAHKVYTIIVKKQKQQ